MSKLHLPPALFLMGPTASGKSALAVQLAQEIGCEIISVDSVQVFRGMDVGTAKPSLEQQQGIAHHLIDILDPIEAFSTGQFRDQALRIMADISSQGKIPLLTGGTMLYFKALYQGLAKLPPANQDIRNKLDEEAAEYGWQVLYQRLALIDPEAALRIHPNDPQRIQRALEVYEICGTSISKLQAEAEMQQIPYQIIKLIIAPEHRKQLHERIAKRFLLMLEQGLLEEVKNLHMRGDLNEKMPSIRAVGYRQVWSYLQGECDYQMMTDKAIAATRQLAKRQFTWLRREQNAMWFRSEQIGSLESILNYLKQA